MSLFAAILIVASLALMGMTAFGAKNPRNIHFGWLGMILWIVALIAIGYKGGMVKGLTALFT